MCTKCNKGKYYITTAITYTSGKPHIGNTYEIILADSIARFKRQEGYDVYFQTGTDEHGQKIQERAEKSGITPKDYVDQLAGEVRRIWDRMNSSHDSFVRTTDQDHEQQVAKIFKKLYEKGDIYKSAYEGLYCTPCESFWTESQLVDGKCPDCGREVNPAKEEAYFFKMSKYADRLIEHINSHPEFIQPVCRIYVCPELRFTGEYQWNLTQNMWSMSGWMPLPIILLKLDMMRRVIHQNFSKRIGLLICI